MIFPRAYIEIRWYNLDFNHQGEVSMEGISPIKLV